MEKKHTLSDLYQMQSLPLSAKVEMTKRRIVQWYEAFDGEVYVAFSGGKDSLALLHLVRSVYPDVIAVFIDTGLEHLAVRKFAISQERVTRIRAAVSFREVLIGIGYPIISKEVAKQVHRYRKQSSKCRSSEEARKFQRSFAAKAFRGVNYRKDGKCSYFNYPHYKFLLDAPFQVSDQCCDIMKKWPAMVFEENSCMRPFIAVRADESRQRENAWQQHGCNMWDGSRPHSHPIAFWKEQDVLQYLWENKLQLASSYGEIIKDEQSCKFHTTGCSRTGCVFCLFGIKYDKDRIVKVQENEPVLADYILRGGEFGEDGYWCPSKEGLGFWFVIEWLNKHGLGIRYKDAQKYRNKYSTIQTEQLL